MKRGVHMLGGRFDSIATPHARKLSGLALCQLLTVPLPALLDRLELIAACVTSVWYEVERQSLHICWVTPGSGDSMCLLQACGIVQC